MSIWEYSHKGRWEIVSGTGAYANLQGNGSNTMSGPRELEEDLVGLFTKGRYIESELLYSYKTKLNEQKSISNRRFINSRQ